MQIAYRNAVPTLQKTHYIFIIYIYIYIYKWMLYKVMRRSAAVKIVGSNGAEGMDVYLLWVLCIVRQKYLRRVDRSSRGVLPTVVRRCVRSKNPKK